MHYVWQHRLVLASDMITTDGERVEVIDPGTLNQDAGPDFFNAKVRIGGEMWCGNVEMHLRASDWKRHGHDDDAAYQSVILHVVGAEDCRVQVAGGRKLPQMIMRCAPDFNERYRAMVDKPTDRLACYTELSSTPGIYVTDCLTAMAFERLYEKADRIVALSRRLLGQWHEAVYVTMARALGFGLNSEPMERLAISVPLRFLLKHRDAIESVEGLLFGQAGLIPPADPDEEGHVTLIRSEYEFLSHKFRLEAPKDIIWKMSRTRPQNFPHRRIGALAAMIHEGFGIASRIVSVKNTQDARNLFNYKASYYWGGRYQFGGKPWVKSTDLFSAGSIDILIINVVAPALYAYGQLYGEDDKQQLAVALLEDLPPERNRVTRLFEEAGVKCPDAFMSQAMVQLRRKYCESRKCLYCRLGHHFLSNKAKYRPGEGIVR